MLLLAIVVAFSWISYISVEKASMAIGADRVTTLADKLSLMFKSSVDQFASTVNSAASNKSVKAFLASPNTGDSLASLETFREFMKKDTTNKLVQLLNTRGQLVLSSGGQVAKLRVNIDSLMTPASPKTGTANVGKFVVVNGLMYFPSLAKITDNTKTIGYLVDWKLMRATQQSIDQLAQLLGANGRLYFGNDDGQIWTDLIRPVARPPVEPVKLQGVAEYSRANGYPVIASMRKIPDSRWLVLIELSNASFQQTAQIYLRWVTLIGLLLIVAGSVGGWLMSRNITKPLKQLSLAAAAIADGDYSPRVNTDRDDELGKLAKSFNIMAARVRAAQQELERMVEERTRELQTAITDIKDQKETDRKKDEFISIASHELKTPLTTLKAFFQLAGREMEPQLKSYNFFGNASRQLNRMERLITDLLDVSKINSGKMQYNFEELDFEKLLKDTIESAQQISPGHRLILERSVSVNVNGDRHRLEQVVVNLLSNAVKYSPEADKVLIWSELKDNKVLVTIKDFGIGISKKDLDGLFDRYYRIEGSEYRFQGLGLGLFISSEILKRHGGSISIQSEPGKGSVFTFELPV
jgi:signal transduction histidine kinase